VTLTISIMDKLKNYFASVGVAEPDKATGAFLLMVANKYKTKTQCPKGIKAMEANLAFSFMCSLEVDDFEAIRTTARSHVSSRTPSTSGETGEDHDAIFALSSALVDQDKTLDLELNGNGTQESLVPKVLILNPDGNIKQDGKQDGNQAEVKEAPFQIKRPPICKFTRKGDNCRIQACKFTHLEQCKIKSHFPQRDFRCKNWHAKKPAASENYVGRTGPSSQTNKFKKTGSNQDSVRSLVEELRITKLELKVKQQADVIKKQKTTYAYIARPGRP
jgi:hypothetical protein